ncbi:MAG: hypothetical protein Q8P84_00630 [Deltaproteobacteria bacterium]|nr:hypothetical protein [Deltaproteobacteria bacterium]MDZ4224311.1 hypothetical protein [bacterium]
MTPGRIKTAIFWEAPKGELALRASLQKNQGALRSAWQKLIAADAPMSLLLRSIGRDIGTIETSPHTDSATWTPLTEEERPWTELQLRHHNFSITQEITLSLHTPDDTTPLQWIAAFLESLRETLRV